MPLAGLQGGKFQTGMGSSGLKTMFQSAGMMSAGLKEAVRFAETGLADLPGRTGESETFDARLNALPSSPEQATCRIVRPGCTWNGRFIFQRAGTRQLVFNISNLPALVSKIPAASRCDRGPVARR